MQQEGVNDDSFELGGGEHRQVVHQLEAATVWYPTHGVNNRKHGLVHSHGTSQPLTLNPNPKP